MSDENLLTKELGHIKIKKLVIRLFLEEEVGRAGGNFFKIIF